MRHAGTRTGAVLLFLAVGASCSDDDASAPTTSEARVEPSTTLSADSLAGDVDDSAPPTPDAAPVEVSACVNPGPEVHVGTEEPSHVSLPEGDMTITRDRRDTWRLTVSDVSDPRLDGTWYVSIDEDRYTLPGDAQGPTLSAWTHRIENDEGAWQGSFLSGDSLDRETSGVQLMLVGEGAHEGLTAVMVGLDEACPNLEGYIIEGNVPAPPVPQTGQ